MNQKYAVIDIEASNSQPNFIIEIAVLIFEKRNESLHLIDEFSSFVRPPISVSKDILKLTGIVEDDLETAPEFFEIAEKIQWMTKDCILVAHHVEFDFEILREHFEKLGQNFKRKTFCTLKASKKDYPSFPKHDLKSLASWFQIDLPFQHRAFDDAFACSEILKKLFYQKKSSTKPSPWQKIKRLFPKANIQPLLSIKAPYVLIEYLTHQKVILVDYTYNFQENIKHKMESAFSLEARRVTSFRLTEFSDPISLLKSYQKACKKHSPILNKKRDQAHWLVNISPKNKWKLTINSLADSRDFILEEFETREQAKNFLKHSLKKEKNTLFYSDEDKKQKVTMAETLKHKFSKKIEYPHSEFSLRFTSPDKQKTSIYLFYDSRLSYALFYEGEALVKEYKMKDNFWLKRRIIHFLEGQKNAKVKSFTIKQLKKHDNRKPSELH